MAPLAPRRPAAVAAAIRPASGPAREPRVRRAAARGRGPADAGSGDQPGAGRRAGGLAAAARLRRGRGPQGRRLRRDQRAARRVRRRPGSSTRCWTSSRSSASRSAPGWPGCCRCPRSSTSPTCTTPPTRFAARRPRCRSSPRAATAIRWWCASPGLPTSKGFGGHFHNDNAVGALRDIPGLIIACPAQAGRRGSDAADVPGQRSRGRERVRLPRADRAVPRA